MTIANLQEAVSSAYEARTANSTLALAWITLGLAIGTLVLAYFTYQLWKAGLDQEDKTRQAIEQSTRAADAAEISVRLSREFHEREVRAYVFVEGVGPVGEGSPWPALRQYYQVRFKNSGKTPAYNVRTRIMTGLRPPQSPELGEAWDDSGIESITTLGPGGERENALRVPSAGAAALRQVRDGELELFIWGKIEYEDVFGKAHHTSVTMRRVQDSQEVVFVGDGNGAD